MLHAVRIYSAESRVFSLQKHYHWMIHVTLKTGKVFFYTFRESAGFWLPIPAPNSLCFIQAKPRAAIILHCPCCSLPEKLTWADIERQSLLQSSSLVYEVLLCNVLYHLLHRPCLRLPSLAKESSPLPYSTNLRYSPLKPAAPSSILLQSV